jgi:hypothetical protein
MTKTATQRRAAAAARRARVREALSSTSLDGRADEIREAYYDSLGSPSGCYEWITDVFEDHLIVRKDDSDFYKVPFTIDGTNADNITFGTPVEVEVQFQDVKEAVVREAWTLTTPKDLTGAIWDARILRFGTSLNGWGWSRESAVSLVTLLDGAPVCLYDGATHASEATIIEAGGAVKERIVGEVRNPRIEDDGVYAEVHIHEGQQLLRDTLLQRAKKTLGHAIGLSVDTVVDYVREGATRAIQLVKRLHSVDIVHMPSADGGLLRATAGPVLTQEEQVMRQKMLALITKHRPALLTGRVIETITDEQLEGLVGEAMQETPKPAPAPAPAPVPPQAVEPQWLTDHKIETARRDTTARVTEALAALPTLPEPVKAKLRKRFDGQVATAEVITAIVKEEVDTLAALSTSGNVTLPNTDPARVLIEPIDKIQAGLDQLFDVTPKGLARAMESAPWDAATTARVSESTKPSYDAAKDPALKFRGLRDFYETVTGDREVTGRLATGRASESQVSANWADILGNTLYRRFLMEYGLPTYNERTIAMFGAAQDFRTKEMVQLDYFPDIATVDPEAADYTEIATLGDDKITYAIIQKGHILTISRKTIINDDLMAVQRLVSRFGRAFRRTLARSIWGPAWVSNGTYAIDSTAWFHTNHANTGTTALSADAAGAAEVLAKVIQLGAMTEPGSLEALGLPDLGSLWLDVPNALFGVARRLNLSDRFSTTETNPVQFFFGQNGERINVNPLFTDTTDWGIHMTPVSSGRESLQVDFLQGRQEPEFFLADQPTIGQAFVGDRIQYKGRHEYNLAAIADFRGACKNVVAGA